MSTGTDEISHVGGAKIVIFSLGTIFSLSAVHFGKI